LKPKSIILALIIGIAVSTLSIYMHHPSTPALLGNWGFKYSDVVYGVFDPRFRPDLNLVGVSEKWYDTVKYYKLMTGTRIFVYPYVDYMLEYPPVIGAIWAVSVNIALLINLPENYSPHYYVEKYPAIASTHYLINALINAFFFLLLVLCIVKATVQLKVSWKRLLLLALLPSIYMYLVYNWDVISAFLLLIGIVCFHEERYLFSGVCIGLSIAAKVLSVLTVPLLLAILVRKNGWRTNKLLLFVAGLTAGSSGFILQAVIAYRSFLDFISYHASWYCENCIYQLVLPDIFSIAHRIASAIAITITIMFITITAWRKPPSGLKELSTLTLCAVVASTALNYVFSPQMILMITPLALLALDRRKLALYAASDTLNALIMILFFQDGYLRRILYGLGFPVALKEFSPWTIDSPIQWISVLRSMILIYIMVSLITSFALSKGSQ